MKILFWGGGDERPCVPYQGINFLTAGFMKCGTTSLYSVLRKMYSVYVPARKETAFFSWFDKVENAEEKLIKSYFSYIRDGQKAVGMIEPSFYLNAKEIRQYFGAEIRIILMMRNPVDASFSMFKMLNRDGYMEDIFEELYQKHGSYHEEMFERYCERIVNDKEYLFYYDYWLKNFLEYFPKEHILVTIFEELLKSPQYEMNRILNFIGIDEKCTCLEFPKINEGSFVMNTIEGYKIAKRRRELQHIVNPYIKTENKSKEKEILREEFVQVNEAYEKADRLSGIKINKKEKEKLRNHFEKSVRNLEKILNKDLSSVWF